MTVCTPHSYAGPRACPHCGLDAIESQLRLLQARDAVATRAIEELQDKLETWKGRAMAAEEATRDWHKVADDRSAEIVRLGAMLEADRAQHAEIRDSRHATATTVLEGYKARIAELEHAIEVWKREEMAWEEREKSIARAVAILETASDIGTVAAYIDTNERALEALR